MNINLKYTCFILLLLIISISCRKNNEQDSIFNNIKNVKCKQVELEATLGKPDQLNKIDNYLIYADEIENDLLTFYDISKKHIVCRCFHKGQGPNDLLMPFRVDVNNQNKVIGIFQRQNGSYKEYNLAELLDNCIIPITKINFPFGAEYVKKYNDNYFTAGFFENGSIAIYNKIGNLQKTINVYPDYLNKITDITNKYRIGQGPIGCLDSIFVFASTFTGDIKFYNISNNYSLIPQKSYYVKTASSNFKERVAESLQKTSIMETDIVHFTQIYTTNNYFYILYSGESMKNNRYAKNSYVLKFDKKGKSIECYKTDCKLFNICINDQDTTLYGVAFSENFDYVIVEASI